MPQRLRSPLTYDIYDRLPDVDRSGVRVEDHADAIRLTDAARDWGIEAEYEKTLDGTYRVFEWWP